MRKGASEPSDARHGEIPTMNATHGALTQTESQGSSNQRLRIDLDLVGFMVVWAEMSVFPARYNTKVE